MELHEYSDDMIVQELKRRKIKISVEDTEFDGVWYNASKININGVIFDI